MKPSEVIEIYGFTQGREGNRDVGFCIMGALYYAYRISQRTMPPPFLVAVIDKVKGVIGYSGVARWNDQPGRTKEEVIELLKSIGE